MNFSLVTSIYLSAYYGMEELKSMYFCIFFIVYLTIITENVLLMGVVYCEKSLHQPMYVLLCNLALNELVGSTALLPATLLNILSYSHEISISFLPDAGLCYTHLCHHRIHYSRGDEL
uniref:OR4L1 n=1 Tax=Poeciliopsis prolifica TaxID=188132 RepID=A0A0S7ESC1_9TELE